jgi:hypothetical protein
MSNIQVFNPGQLPAFAKKGELSAIAKALAGGSMQTGKRISIKGGVFRLIADGKEVAAIDERYLDVVVVNAAPKVSRTFYAGVYNENNPTPPACYSSDGDKPDATVKAPQCANCAQCPQNVAGSGQGDSRACRYGQKLAVVLANDMEGDVMQLQLAATSLFGKADGDNRPMQEYAKWLTAQGIDPTMLVTRLKFDTKAPTPKLFFKAMRWLTDEEFAMTQDKGKSKDALNAIHMTVAQTDGVQAPAPAPFTAPGNPPKLAKPAPAPAADDEDDEPPAPAPKATRAAKVAKPAPAPAADDDEAPAPEPTVRKAAAAAPTAVPAASGLAQALADWDDE